MNTASVKQLLQQKAKADLGFYPTPLYRLNNLSKKLGINLYIKREDFLGRVYLAVIKSGNSST